MSEWISLLKSDPIDWLLERDNPSVRYFTLTDILDRPADDVDVMQAKADIMEAGMVPEILKMQREPDYPQSFPRFYTNKYDGLVWQLIALAELGATANEQIRAQCEYLLENSQERTDGGFSMNTAVKTGGGRLSEVIPCLTGNMVWALARLGYEKDPRVQRGAGWLAAFMRYNDGEELDPQVEPYNRYEMCWGRHTCHMGVVKALKAFSAIPGELRTPQANDTIARGVEFMLIHHVFRQSHNLKKATKPGWTRFGFPMMYQTDVLEILDILTSLGIKDSRMQQAVDLVVSKQDDTGRWHVGNTYASGKMLIPLEAQGEPSKHITLRALRVLKRYT